DLDAFHNWANRFEHFLRDADAFAARGVGCVGLSHAQHDFFRHGYAQVVFHEFRVAQAGERPNAGDHRNAEFPDAFQKILEQAQIEDRLGDDIFGASLHFVGEAAQLVLKIWHAGIGSDGDGEVGARADGVGPDIETVIQAVHHVDETDGVHVKHSSRVRIIAHLRRIAGEAEYVAQPDRRRAQQIGLDGNDVSVAAGVMQNGFNSGMLLNLNAETLGAQTGRGAG